MTDRPAITLHLTGSFAVSNADGSTCQGLSRRAQAMLAYLSQQRDMRAERGALADLLWSDRSEDQARASLRQELSVLRRSLPDALLQADRQAVWLDAARVSLDQNGPGEFLQGFDLPSEGFEDWLREARMAPRVDVAADSPPGDIFQRPAVLLFAFETLSRGEEDEMIAAGLVDDLRTTLCYWRWFPVIGPEAIGWQTGKGVDLREVAASVDAAYAITGSMRCLGNKVRISVNLSDAETGRIRWSQQFYGTLDDIFAFQEDASRAIVAQLEPQIARAEVHKLQRHRPKTIGPWQLLAQADEIDRKGGEGYGTWESNSAQISLMENALALDTNFAPAHARLGRIYFRASLLGWKQDRDGTMRLAVEHSEKALEIDPENWEAHGYCGLSRIFGFQDYSKGYLNVMEAVRLNPSASLAHHAAGCGLEWMGQPEEALAHLNLIFRLNPNHPGRAAAWGDITTCEMFVGNKGGALDAAEKLFAIAPGYARGLQRCVATFGYFDKDDLARKSLNLLLEAQPDFDEAYVRETYPYVDPVHTEMLIEGMRKAGAF